MIRCTHIFTELKELLPQLAERYKPKDVFYIGLRLHDNQVPKVEVFFEELIPVLFNIIDTNDRSDLSRDEIHPIWREKDYANGVLKSIFICDVSSQTVYDSRQYQPSNQKYQLTQDKDGRIRQFTRLDDEEKEQALELTMLQIAKMYEDMENGQEPEDSGTDSCWEEMPWDFPE